MPGYDPTRAVTWVITTLKAASAVTTLLGGQKVYRDTIPASVALPAIAVSIQSIQEAPRPIRRKSGSWEFTPLQVLVKIVSKDQYATSIADAVITALDANFDVALTDGTLNYCYKGIDPTPYEERDVQDKNTVYKHLPLLWKIGAKTT